MSAGFKQFGTYVESEKSPVRERYFLSVTVADSGDEKAMSRWCVRGL
jgi:hypothetical protein